jgi:hypothetical protein
MRVCQNSKSAQANLLVRQEKYVEALPLYQWVWRQR